MQPPSTRKTLNSGAWPEMHDIDLDGCPDLAMVSSLTPVSMQTPLVYRNNGSGQFTALPPAPFLATGFDGALAVFADVNGDGAIDLVSPTPHNGPDGEHRTADDYTTLATALNTTPSGPVRCGE